MGTPSTAPTNNTPSSHPPPAKGKRRKSPAPRLCLVPPPPPGDGIWGPLGSYEYQNYIKYLRRIKDTSRRTLIRAKAQELADGVLGIVDSAIEFATESMETQNGAAMVLEFAADILKAAEAPKPVELKVFEGGTPPPPPPPADERRRS